MENSKMNPVWNCPFCGERMSVSGRINSTVEMHCHRCGNRSKFDDFEALAKYEDTLLEMQVIRPVTKPKDVARETLLSMQCAHLVH